MLFVHWFLWPLRLVWLLVCCLYKEVYLQIFKYVSFWLHGCCGESEGGPVNQVNHTSWMTVVTPTDRPKSVRNCCLIELFCSVVCVVTLPFWHFFCSRVFCHRTWSDLLLFALKLLGECHCWWTKESPRAHVGTFCGRLRLIRGGLRASIFSVLNLIVIVIIWVYYTIRLVSSLFKHLLGI